MICDPNYDNKTKNLFLNAILSAKKYLYISYIGDLIYDDYKYYPLEFGVEIINYVINNFYLLGDEKLSCNVIKKNMFLHLCKIHTDINHFTYDFSKHKIDNDKDINFIKHIPSFKSIKTNHIELARLMSFWKNPVHEFFNQNLKIKIVLPKKNINQNIILDNFNHYKMKVNILESMINNHDTNSVFEYYCNKGLIPNNSFGYSYFEKQKIDIKSLFKKIAYIKKTSIIKKNFYIKINQYYLSGTLKKIRNIGIIHWKPKIITIYDIILLWVEHLIYCYLGGKNQSKIIGFNNYEWIFNNLNKASAQHYLSEYLSGYIKGLQKPILLSKAGINWFNIVYDKKNKNIIKNPCIQKKGIKQLINTWYGNKYKEGEKNDIFLNKIIPILNENYILEICHTTQYWLLPLFNHRKKK